MTLSDVSPDTSNLTPSEILEPSGVSNLGNQILPRQMQMVTEKSAATTCPISRGKG